MKIISKIFFVIAFLFPLSINGQSCSNYFPIHIGDTWEWYSVDDSTYFDTLTNIVEKNDSSMDVYFNDSEKPRYNIKKDGNVYQYFNDNTLKIWYDFTVAPEDTFYTTIYSSFYYVIVDSIEGNLFGDQTKIKIFTWINIDYPSLRSEQRVSEKFGLYYTKSFLGPIHSYVIGCKIDGLTYGSLVNVEDSEPDILNSFNISQNYPNPFNSTTNIEYFLKQDVFVNISIYNSLGEKIETLVNEFKPRGYYKITFNGHRLSSSIYFYKISANGESQIKKMQLLK